MVEKYDLFSCLRLGGGSGVHTVDTLHQSQSEGSFLKETNVVWPKTWKLAQPCIKNSIAFFSAPSGLYFIIFYFRF
jgi:hypothetical protein